MASVRALAKKGRLDALETAKTDVSSRVQAYAAFHLALREAPADLVDHPLIAAVMHLPDPFFVIATQNPQEQIGTFPLPESQLDRFLMRVRLGYPAAAAERELLAGTDRRELVNSLPSVLSVEDLRSLQQAVLAVHVSPALLDYVQALVAHTRSAAGLSVGLSPRAAIGLLRAARAWALISSRNTVFPEHVQAVFAAVVEHRLEQRDRGPAAANRLLEAVPIP